MSEPPPGLISRAPTIPGADPQTRKPGIELPPRSCDCHAHVFGPQNRYPYVQNAGYIPPDALPGDYVRMLQTIGCERGVLVQPSVYGTDNTAMIDALRSGVFSFRGVAVIDEDIGDGELEAMHKAGVRGVRINLASATPGLTLDQAPRLAARLKALGWHLQFYMNLKKTPDVEERLSKLAIDIVIDHFGHIGAADGLQAPAFQALLRLAGSERCWFKLIGPYRISKQPPLFADVIPFAQALLAAAPERCVWGTDWPHPNAAFMPNDGDLADMLSEWIPDEALRKRVLVENPTRLYGF